MRIIPTVFALDRTEFLKRFEKIVKISEEIQIDFMDGEFVKAKSVNLKDIPNLKKYNEKEFEAHLMVNEPIEWIEGLKKKGFKKIIFHYESFDKDDELLELIDLIKKSKREVWMAINPDTDIREIEDFLEEVKGILLMGVYPGKEGQSFIQKTYGKIKRLKNIDENIKIQVDGGVNFNTIKKIKQAGADIVNVGGLVGKADNPKEILSLLKKEAI